MTLIRVLLFAALLGAVGATVGHASAAIRSEPSLSGPEAVVEWVAPRLNTYWHDVLTRDGLAYRSPPYYSWYNGPVRGWLHTPRRCDIYRRRDGLMWAGYSREYAPNSFYCATNENFYFDWRLWDGLPRGGSVVLAAHEWGHHVQNLLGWPVREREHRHAYANYELMADCYAGTFMRYERRRRELNDRDVAQGKRLLARFGDVERTPWSTPQSHGTRADRWAWFSRGYGTGDPKVCAELFGRAGY